MHDSFILYRAQLKLPVEKRGELKPMQRERILAAISDLDEERKA